MAFFTGIRKTGGVDFSLDLAYAKSLGYTITQVHVTLTHRTTNATSENDLPIDSVSLSATEIIRNLRPGMWDISVELYDAAGLLATGTGMVEVVLGTTVAAEIHITLGGDVEITVTWESMLKDAALAFSLKVLDTYFDPSIAGYELFLTYIHDPVYPLEGEGPLSLSEILWEGSHPFGQNYSAHTMDEYLEVYNPIVLNYDEIVALAPDFESFAVDDWIPNKDDYLFLGWEVRDGRTAFMWEDLLCFMVTCGTDGEWKLIAFSG